MSDLTPTNNTNSATEAIPEKTSTTASSPAESRPAMQFLSLAPATSASYPQSQAHRDSVSSNTSSEDAAAPSKPVYRRRTSSASTGHRVLKLGPVHWGEHVGENKDDFHDIEPKDESTHV